MLATCMCWYGNENYVTVHVAVVVGLLVCLLHFVRLKGIHAHCTPCSQTLLAFKDTTASTIPGKTRIVEISSWMLMSFYRCFHILLERACDVIGVHFTSCIRWGQHAISDYNSFSKVIYNLCIMNKHPIKVKQLGWLWQADLLTWSWHSCYINADKGRFIYAYTSLSSHWPIVSAVVHNIIELNSTASSTFDVSWHDNSFFTWVGPMLATKCTNFSFWKRELCAKTGS